MTSSPLIATHEAGVRAQRGAHPGRRVRRAVVRRGPAVLTTAALIGLWEVLVHANVLPQSAFPTVEGVVTAAHREWQGGTLSTAFLDTVRSWGLGLAASIAIGIPLGVLIGTSDFAYRSTRLLIDFLRSLPPLAVLPLITFLYGAGLRGMIILIVLGAVWPILLQTFDGVRDVDPSLRDVATSYSLPRRTFLRTVSIPTAAPFIATGVRVAATIALLVAVGTELVAGTPGIGVQIGLRQSTGLVGATYAYIAITGFMGLALAVILEGVERRVLRWHPSHREVRV